MDFCGITLSCAVASSGQSQPPTCSPASQRSQLQRIICISPCLELGEEGRKGKEESEGKGKDTRPLWVHSPKKVEYTPRGGPCMSYGRFRYSTEIATPLTNNSWSTKNFMEKNSFTRELENSGFSEKMRFDLWLPGKTQFLPKT